MQWRLYSAFLLRELRTWWTALPRGCDGVTGIVGDLV